MNELISIQNHIEDKYEEYIELIAKRDNYRKAGFNYSCEYIRVFGELMNRAFEEKINCIKKKKIISFCQKKINAIDEINQIELDNYINNVMEEYNEELNRMIEDFNSCKNGEILTNIEFSQLKRAYRRIAKKIHPDINPLFADNETITELWNRAVLAYKCNRLEDLEEVEVLINNYLQDMNYVSEDYYIDNIDIKIQKILESIEKIINSNPYQYKYILSNKEKVKEIKDNLKKEIEYYINYSKELDRIISEFDIRRAYSWQTILP